MGKITLTQKDREILLSYRTMIQALSEYLGTGYELVLHSLDNLDASVIEICNGHYTGRTIGSPITDLALRMLSEIEKDPAKNIITYYANNKAGCPMKSCTIAVRGEHSRVIGLLCINFYLNTSLFDIFKDFSPNLSDTGADTEHFSDNVDDLFENAIQDAVTKVNMNPSISSANRNREIIRILYQQRIFTLKDAVQQVSDHLRISKNTVYLHLRNIENN